MRNVVDEQLHYPQSVDFGPKPGGYDVLNVPASDYAGMSEEEFWRTYNKPFLDAAVDRGDPIYLATPPTDPTLYRSFDNSVTGFGREYKNLIQQKGYKYYPQLNQLVKPGS
jgi:hypothetical protein